MTYGVKNVKIAPVKLLCIVIVALLLIAGLLRVQYGYGDQLPSRSLILSSSVAGTSSVTYQLNFSLQAPQTLGSIELQFCQEGPLLGTPCTAPAGINVGSAVLSNQSGETGFAISGLSDAHTIILSRGAAALSTATNLSYTFTNVTNPTATGSFYGRLQTFATTNASGSSTDSGGLAMTIVPGVNVSATVPPYLYFCIGITITGTDCNTTTGDYINFGDFTSAVTSTATTQMVAGTNGPTGYGIAAGGTTLTSGINIIPSMASPDVSRPGTGQFGLNLVANSDPTVGQNPSGAGSGSPTANYNTPNQYTFNSGEIVASHPVPDYPRKFTTSYIANIPSSQEPGIYVSTLTYIATAGF